MAVYLGTQKVDTHGLVVDNSHYDLFWDTYQCCGERKNYEYAFRNINGGVSENYKLYAFWTEETFRPKYDIKPTESLTGTFNACQITDLESWLIDCDVILDLSGVTNATNSFSASIIETLPELDFSNVTAFARTFYNSSKIKTIRKIITNANATHNSTFYGCAGLEHIIFEGEIGKSLNLASSPLLNDASIQSVIDCLIDLTDSTAQTIYVHSNVLAKITEEQWTSALNKNWNIE